MQSKTIIDLLSNETCRQFIGEHIKDDVKKLVLGAHRYANIDVKALASLILLYRKAELKLPEHYMAMAALNDKSYEQATSEAVALYKAGIMGLQNKTVINLTGGLGVDDWAMVKYASRIDSCETDEDIHNMAVYNIGLFGNYKIKRHLTDGIGFINECEKADIIYADPDRRSGAGKKFRIEDSVPDILPLMDLMLNKAHEVWIKLSPMADITYVEKLFPSLKKIYVIAWLGEVKEILINCAGSGSQEIKKVAVNIGSNEIFCFEKQKNNQVPNYENEGKYLFEPNRAIIKAGLSSEYALFSNVSMLSPQSNFFISDLLPANFQGRKFEVIKQLPYKPRIIKEYLKSQKIIQANITIRNFRETAEMLRTRFRLNDGGNHTLCFTTDKAGIGWLYHCVLI